MYYNSIDPSSGRFAAKKTQQQYRFHSNFLDFDDIPSNLSHKNPISGSAMVHVRTNI